MVTPSQRVLWWPCLSVCLYMSVCLSAYLRNHTYQLHRIVCTCCLWLWLGPLLVTLRYVNYFRFCGSFCFTFSYTLLRSLLGDRRPRLDESFVLRGPGQSMHWIIVLFYSTTFISAVWPRWGLGGFKSGSLNPPPLAFFATRGICTKPIKKLSDTSSPPEILSVISQYWALDSCQNASKSILKSADSNVIILQQLSFPRPPYELRAWVPSQAQPPVTPYNRNRSRARRRFLSMDITAVEFVWMIETVVESVAASWIINTSSVDFTRKLVERAVGRLRHGW